MKRRKNAAFKRISNKYLMSLLCAAVLAIAGFISRQNTGDITGGLPSSSPLSNFPLDSKKKSPLAAGTYPVVHIVDGDTLDVVDGANNKYRIRLIGANTPETVKPNSPVEPFGPEASAFTKQMVAGAGNKVLLVYDGDQIDKYGRTLAFVYLNLPQGTVCLNELLVLQGLAKAEVNYHFSKDAKERLSQAQEKAKQAKRNIWK